MDKRERNRLVILAALRKASSPLSSARLVERLATAGHQLSERAVRLYLNELDTAGLTENHGKKGRTITEAGLTELHASQILQRVGYLSARIDQMTYAMSFDMPTCSGTVVVNTSVVAPEILAIGLDDVCSVFEKGYAVGKLACLVGPGETIGEVTIPDGKIGFCTVCSITLNGVLLKHGIPTHSRFGGLLQLQAGRPTRFVEVIHYNGTSIDPLEVFIRAGMTNYRGAIRDGNGRVGASFREMPEDSRERLLHLSDRMASLGLGALLEVGLGSQPVLGLPVAPGLIGAVVIGGLNPIAILEEMGHRVDSRALGGLLDYSRLSPYTDLAKALRSYL